MKKIICPKCKSEDGFEKNKQCKTKWMCSKCKECCVYKKEREQLRLKLF